MKPTNNNDNTYYKVKQSHKTSEIPSHFLDGVNQIHDVSKRITDRSYSVRIGSSVCCEDISTMLVGWLKSQPELRYIDNETVEIRQQMVFGSFNESLYSEYCRNEKE